MGRERKEKRGGKKVEGRGGVLELGVSEVVTLPSPLLPSSLHFLFLILMYMLCHLQPLLVTGNQSRLSHVMSCQFRSCYVTSSYIYNMIIKIVMKKLLLGLKICREIKNNVRH